MKKRVVVFDTEEKIFLSNRIFDPNYACKYPGATLWSLFYKLGTEKGWEILTGDVFLNNRPDGDVLLISDMWTSRTNQILKLGATPLIITTGESPNVAWKFYLNLHRYSDPFKYCIVYPGAMRLVSQKSLFLPFYWPSSENAMLFQKPWNNRDRLVMISSNKNRNMISPSWKGKMKWLVRRLMWLALPLLNPRMGFEDLYRKRLDALKYFSENNGISLFGRGWENEESLPETIARSIRRLKPKVVEDKIQTLSKYKFCLCMENCVFPGYITEKLFDCFFAGCIPLYLGAPDIEKYIPLDTFIDLRGLKTWETVNAIIEHFSQPQAEKITSAIHRFLKTKYFERFVERQIANKYLEITEKAFDEAANKDTIYGND